MNIPLTLIISFLVTYVSTFFLRRLAFGLHILDLPGGRKIHKSATPLLGGLGVYLGFLTGVFLNWAAVRGFWPIIIGSGVIILIGLIDDIIGLSALFRLIVQIVVSIFIVSLGERISFLPPTILGNSIEIIITVIWIVGLTNAYNYLDGLDALASGSAAINLFFFAIILFIFKQPHLVMFSTVLIASCIGFIPYNLSRRKVFLGDAGSTFLGFILANIALVGNWAEDNVVKISIPVFILGVPIFDMIFTTIMRIREEKVKTFLEWLRYGGKDHFHHYLVDLGLGHLGSVVFIYFVTISLGISAVMVSNDRAFEALLSFSQASIIFGMIAILIVMGKRHRRNKA